MNDLTVLPKLRAHYEKFEGFKGARREVFSVEDQYSLDINAACQVGILPGELNSVSVEIDASPDDAANFKLAQIGDRIFIHQLEGARNNSSVSISMSGGGMSINIGSVKANNLTINGQRISIDGTNPNSQPVRVLIRAPANGNVNAKLIGNESLLVSAVPINEAFIEVSDRAKAGLAAKTLTVKADDRSEVRAVVTCGVLDATLFDRGEAHIEGIFSTVKANVSDRGVLTTKGNVQSGYSAFAEDRGQIIHRGEISGRIRENRKDRASIDLG